MVSLYSTIQRGVSVTSESVLQRNEKANMCPRVVQRIKAKGRKIESLASTSFQTPEEKRKCRRMAFGVDTVFETVVLRTIYIRERRIQTLNEKSFNLQVAILKVITLKRNGFRRKSKKGKRINFNRKSGR